MRRPGFAAVVVAVLLLAGAAGGTAAAPAGTVWLCRPGVVPDPCTRDLTATVVARNGTAHVARAQPAANPPIDCFYVYPTVSEQPTTNANLRIDPQERAVAVAQASRFSQVCRVYAPMYPQLTLSALAKPGGMTAAGALTAYAGVASAFRDYLAHWNHGRGIVFIGHSQGAGVLIALLAHEVDSEPSVRQRLVSALLLGGNVTVARGRLVGGSFAHIPACRALREAGCVVAYSTFSRTPPPDSNFGRVGSALNPFATGAARAGLQVMCVNPAAPGGGQATLDPYFPSAAVPLLARRGGSATAPSTPWVAYPGEYTARCRSTGGATWLQVTPTRGAPDHRPLVTEAQGPTWGLHTVDVNIALGNLVALVRAETAAYRAR